MKHIRYKSHFYDRNDRRYDIEILQEVDSITAPEGWPATIQLAADPLEIEWSEVSKLDPVQGSCATLRVLSMTDRQFFDMYTVNYGTIELRVYRDPSAGAGLLTPNRIQLEGFNTAKAQYPVASDITVSATRYNAEGVYIGTVSSTIYAGETETTLFAIEGVNTLSDLQIEGSSIDAIYRYHTTDTLLYWAGTLDPELFEEPYAYNNRYVTELSFVDLAPLDYVYWGAKGLMSIRTIVEKCVESAKFLHAKPFFEMIATQTSDQESAFACTVQAENFYDDDGEPMTMREVLEEVLRPFAVRLIQKDGIMVLFDLHSLHGVAPATISWYGTDSTVEADRVYNDVTVKFSPYQDETILEAAIDEDEALNEGDDGVISQLVYGYTDPTIGVGGSTDGDVTAFEAFTLLLKQAPVELKNLKVKTGACVYRVQPKYSGEKESGIIWSFSVSYPSRQGQQWPFYGNTNAPFCAMGNNYKGLYPEYSVTPIIETSGIYISSDAPDAKILVTVEAMYDARYNWFEAADAYKTKNPLKTYDYTGNRSYIQDKDMCLIPVVITVRDDAGNPIYRYSNNSRRIGFDPSNPTQTDEEVGWYKIKPDEDIYARPAWFAYYGEDIEGKGIMSDGWKKNSRLLYSNTTSIPITISSKNNGEYLPMPPESGYLVVEVCAGHLFMTYAGNELTTLNNAVGPTDPVYTEKARTVAYKSIEIKIVPEYGADKVEATDIEDIAWLNKSARENLSISTIVGTPNKKMPAAKGALRLPSGAQVDSFTRGDHVGRLEKLLIGTAYSQYAERKNVLQGTADMLLGFYPLIDQSIDGRYVLLSEVQNVEKGTSNIRAAEFNADEYDSIEEKEE